MNKPEGPGSKTTPEQPPLPVCPHCGMVKNDWPGEGYAHDGEIYCCQGCAEGTRCTCVEVAAPGFSREGQTTTRAEPRPGEQRSGALVPHGELSGQRDSVGTEEAIDQSGNSTLFPPSDVSPDEPEDARSLLRATPREAGGA